MCWGEFFLKKEFWLLLSFENEWLADRVYGNLASMVFSLRYFLCLFLLSFPGTFTYAQTSPKDVAHSLEKKTVLLRDGYFETMLPSPGNPNPKPTGALPNGVTIQKATQTDVNENLSFDAQGSPSGNLAAGNFPLSAVTVQKIKLTNSQLEIHGQRNVLISNGKDGTSAGEKIGYFSIKHKVHITIQLDTAHTESLAIAVQKIFAFSVQELLENQTPSQREKWLASLASFVPEPKPITDPKPDTVSSIAGFDKIYSPKRGVTPPRLIFFTDPEFPPDAREKKIGGISVVSLIVDQAGNPEHIRIIQPLGSGFDEKAIAAVSQYRFKPALLNDQPVNVELHIEVNFRFY